MPSLRRGMSAPPKKVFRNGSEIKKIMRGTIEMWSSRLSKDAKVRLPFDASVLEVVPQSTSISSSGTAPSLVDQSANFNANGRLLVGPGANYMNGFGVSFWIKTTSTRGYTTILYAPNSLSGTISHEWAVALYADSTGRIYANWDNGSGPPVDHHATGKKVNDGAWHHVAVWTDRLSNTSAKTSIAVDGVSYGGTTNNSQVAPTSFMPPWVYIGGARATNEYVGQLDDLCLWGPGELESRYQELYAQGRQG